jgi:hypothetical protein
VHDVVDGVPTLTDRGIQIIVRLDGPGQAWKQRLSDLTFNEKCVLPVLVELTATKSLGRDLSAVDGAELELVRKRI